MGKRTRSEEGSLLGRRRRSELPPSPEAYAGNQLKSVHAPLGTEKDMPSGYFDAVEDTQTFINDVVAECMAIGASDIHLTSSASELMIRARVDSTLIPVRSVTGSIATAIMNNFRANNGLSTSQSFIPQETTFYVDVDGESLGVRVVSFPRAAPGDPAGGGATVLRLPESGPLRTVDELGFSDQNKAEFLRTLDAGNQMMLIAGPMGCGKSTTARAALLHISGPGNSVWSLEDPVERLIPGVTQISVNEKQGAGFDTLMPHLLRADYDTLFLGEIRDPKTAAAGVRQAKAGRQVITTIHANNNVTALLRLIDLAQDSPLSVLDSVRGVVSQRMIARRNPDWAEGDDPAFRYKGRTPIHELLTVNDDIVEAVMASVPLNELKSLAAKASVNTFANDLARLVEAGVTDVEEAERVLRAN